MGMDKNLMTIIYIVIGALVVTALLQGLKSTALASAYDSANATTITDSSGVEHVVAASPIGGATTALLYTIAQGLVWLFAIVGILMLALKPHK